MPFFPVITLKTRAIYPIYLRLHPKHITIKRLLNQITSNAVITTHFIQQALPHWNFSMGHRIIFLLHTDFDRASETYSAA